MEAPKAEKFEFTIPDRKGVDHRYEGTMFLASIGLEIGNEVMQLVMPPVVEGFTTGTVDTETIRQCLKGLRKELLLKLLGTMFRDGYIVNPATFDVVYSGNYNEMWAAAYEVVRANGFLPLPFSLPSANEIFSLADRTPNPFAAMPSGPTPTAEG